MAVKGISVAVISIGGILVWSGLQNKKITQTVQDLVRGKQPQPGPESSIDSGSGSVPVVGSTGPGAPDVNQANRVLGRTMAAAMGWTGDQWTALDNLWTRESRWQNKIANPTSGAYGIPQALPGSKMGTAANPPLSSAVAQIRWGLSYIKQRYRNPVNAWA